MQFVAKCSIDLGYRISSITSIKKIKKGSIDRYKKNNLKNVFMVASWKL